MKFWISWIQPTEDYRPLADPPNVAVLGWWCSGYDADDHATLCACVQVKSEPSAKAAVRIDWPEARDWRFCEPKPDDFTPGDRFPLNGWAKKRFERIPSPRRRRAERKSK